jgi:GIY-YIG catalytic domain
MSYIAYKAGIELRDSRVTTYRIYHLRNPINNEIFYVGKTAAELKHRLTGHLGSINIGGANQGKNDIIKSILAENQTPLIEEIYVIYGTCHIHQVEASEKEYFWINKYYKSGIKLTNVFGIQTATLCKEWEKYQKNLKEGKCDMNNYLCGITRNGVPVYDIEKLGDDGFSVNESEHIYNPPPPAATPTPTKEWTYEKIYSDNDPNYIVCSFEET